MYLEDEITLFNKASYLLDSTGNYSYSTVLDNIKTNSKAQEKLAILVRKYSSESNVLREIRSMCNRMYPTFPSS